MFSTQKTSFADSTIACRFTNSFHNYTLYKPLAPKRRSGADCLGSGDRYLIHFCLGTAAGLRPAVTNVSPLECLQRSWEMRSEEKNEELKWTHKVGRVNNCEPVRMPLLFYSLVCSYRLNSVNFFEYISDVINKAAALPPNTPLEKYRMLLPDKWKENR